MRLLEAARKDLLAFLGLLFTLFGTRSGEGCHSVRSKPKRESTPTTAETSRRSRRTSCSRKSKRNTLRESGISPDSRGRVSRGNRLLQPPKRRLRPGVRSRSEANARAHARVPSGMDFRVQADTPLPLQPFPLRAALPNTGRFIAGRGGSEPPPGSESLEVASRDLESLVSIKNAEDDLFNGGVVSKLCRFAILILRKSPQSANRLPHDAACRACPAKPEAEPGRLRPTLLRNSQYGGEAPCGATTNAQNRRERVCRVPARACFIDVARHVENCCAERGGVDGFSLSVLPCAP